MLQRPDSYVLQLEASKSRMIPSLVRSGERSAPAQPVTGAGRTAGHRPRVPTAGTATQKA